MQCASIAQFKERAELKSYFLEELTDEQKARDRLSATLPAQSAPWVLLDCDGDAVAYFNITMLEDDRGLAIQADVSGRHFEKDAEVLTMLRSLQAELGGIIRDDHDVDIT